MQDMLRSGRFEELGRVSKLVCLVEPDKINAGASPASLSRIGIAPLLTDFQVDAASYCTNFMFTPVIPWLMFAILSFGVLLNHHAPFGAAKT